MSKIIELKNVNKWFDKFQALKDVNLEVNQQEKIVICGPSGSGKSTLIRCINRLEEHQEGHIVVDGNEISEKTKDIEKIRAEVGMVFQQFNLFPHLSILDNCTLAPIWVKKLTKKQAEEIAMANLKRVQIDDQALKFPGQLSGGQHRKLAFAPHINIGVFSMEANSPGWSSWQKNLIQTLKAGNIFGSEGLAINMSVYIDELKTEFLPLNCNWIISNLLPKYDESKNTFVEPFLPNYKIGIMHLAAGIWKDGKDMRINKDIKIKIENLEGRFLEKSLRFSK